MKYPVLPRHGLVNRRNHRSEHCKGSFNVCHMGGREEGKKHLGIFSKARIWDCIGMLFYGLDCVT